MNIQHEAEIKRKNDQLQQLQLMIDQLKGNPKLEELKKEVGKLNTLLAQ